uniref:Uncharacterized protein n=1 Tax=Cucumis sativus TaxID=3659 RepID=A0A0A0KGL1_CUCSA
MTVSLKELKPSIEFECIRSISFLFCLNVAPSVLFFLPKQVLVNARHSSRFTSGTSFLGRINTTDESTLGQGTKSLLLTSMTCSTSATSFTLTAKRLYSESPGSANNRRANSF